MLHAHCRFKCHLWQLILSWIQCYSCHVTHTAWLMVWTSHHYYRWHEGNTGQYESANLSEYFSCSTSHIVSYLLQRARKKRSQFWVNFVTWSMSVLQNFDDIGNFIHIYMHKIHLSTYALKRYRWEILYIIASTVPYIQQSTKSTSFRLFLSVWAVTVELRENLNWIKSKPFTVLW